MSQFIKEITRATEEDRKRRSKRTYNSSSVRSISFLERPGSRNRGFLKSRYISYHEPGQKLTLFFSLSQVGKVKVIIHTMSKPHQKYLTLFFQAEPRESESDPFGVLVHLNSILETEEERFVKKQTISVIENVMKEPFRPFHHLFTFTFFDMNMQQK